MFQSPPTFLYVCFIFRISMDSCVLVDSMCYHALLSSSFSMLRLSQVWPGSPSLRTCSRAVGPRLLHITSFTLRWSKKIRSHLVLFLSQPRNNLFFQEIPVPFNGEWYLGTRSGRCCLLLLRWLTDRAWKLVKKKAWVHSDTCPPNPTSQGFSLPLWI